MQNRYAANLGAFSAAQLAAAGQKSVCIVGCGALGGYTANALARFGVRKITLVDGDCFQESNQNRQLFALPKTLGQNKAETTASALREINDAVRVHPVPVMLDAANAQAILAGHDLALDCLDNPQARMQLEDACAALGIPFVHAAIDGFFGQVATVFPHDGLMRRLYGEGGVACAQSNPVFTAQAVSAIQSCEAIKLLAGDSTTFTGLLHINLQDTVFTLLEG